MPRTKSDITICLLDLILGCLMAILWKEIGVTEIERGFVMDMSTKRHDLMAEYVYPVAEGKASEKLS